MKWWMPATSPGFDYCSTPPQPGWLIAIHRKPYEVVAITPRLPGDWSERAVEMWYVANMPDPWPDAPYRVELLSLPERELCAVTIEPWHRMWFNRLRDHYAVCVQCGELSPCPEPACNGGYHLTTRPPGDHYPQEEMA